MASQNLSHFKQLAEEIERGLYYKKIKKSKNKYKAFLELSASYTFVVTTTSLAEMMAILISVTQAMKIKLDCNKCLTFSTIAALQNQSGENPRHYLCDIKPN